MTLEEFLSGVREFTGWVAENDPELNYIVFTGVGLTTDGTVPNHLLNTHANISQGTLNGIAAGWNYADAACSIITVGELLLQNYFDEVNDKNRIENYAKAAVLTASVTTLIAMTAAGMGAWGFAIATICDFGIASWDFYRSARKYWDFDYWLEEQLYELDYLSRKISEPDVGDKLSYFQARKTHIIKNIKAYSTYHYHQKLIKSDVEDKSKEAREFEANFNESFNKICASYNFTHIKRSDKAEILTHVSSKYIQIPRNSDKFRAKQIKENLKKDTQDKGIKLALKTASMVGMILLAVAASCHPVGLAITAGVAAGYLLYSFGFPAAKKLWNHCCKAPEKTLSKFQLQTDELLRVEDKIISNNLDDDKIDLFDLLNNNGLFYSNKNATNIDDKFSSYARRVLASIDNEEANDFLDFFYDQVDEQHQEELLPVLLDDFIIYKDIGRISQLNKSYDNLIKGQATNDHKYSKVNGYLEDTITESIAKYAKRLRQDETLPVKIQLDKFKKFNDLLIKRETDMMGFYLNRKNKIGRLELEIDVNEFISFVEHGLNYKHTPAKLFYSESSYQRDDIDSLTMVG
ncbi:MAG: hypothetical protein EP298_03930 [Gammaproteobacteria bacterium]|nr:MAG: hypothetical protein EP298_03930 [Gammaproteobacteria bacterium]UTW43778.1 hypothetical protein KFE69_06735 [bacterium SCSIO 12844]